ncbi:DUF1318 domain-containing protein [Pseudodesulfovibrio sp. zrk46]|uniref:DUF1318 domain-containing protein n=1 Tax=Pseudodesulfovibrio sp. zrk46 TaxID=2725288 RepID=UPI0014494F02|nr:DUF1318 domain-containing protein [Pseudodesulfovibrio sp. zrk46]QJB56626.1 YdbL family protein [Pseudodesulfovibrio sp. zrk46]
MRSLPVIIALCMLVTAVAAQADDLKERMTKRKPTIDAMLADGTLGENNIGLLEYRGKELHLAIIKQENEDRLKLYKALGKRMDKTFTEVGILKARKIAKEAPIGTWLQNERGHWYRK